VQLSEGPQHSLLAVGAVSSCGFQVCCLPQILFAACSPLQKKSQHIANFDKICFVGQISNDKLKFLSCP
jgi:hypothetical protein